MLTRNKETLCWELSGEKSPEYTEPPEPVLEAIGGFINADNLIWEGTATELIEKLGLDMKPNVVSLKLNVNAGRLMNDYSIRYTNKRNHSGRMIFFVIKRVNFKWLACQSVTVVTMFCERCNHRHHRHTSSRRWRFIRRSSLAEPR